MMRVLGALRLLQQRGVIERNADCFDILLTLGAYASQGYGSCLCLSVSPYSRPTAHEAASQGHSLPNYLDYHAKMAAFES